MTVVLICAPRHSHDSSIINNKKKEKVRPLFILELFYLYGAVFCTCLSIKVDGGRCGNCTRYINTAQLLSVWYLLIELVSRVYNKGTRVQLYFELVSSMIEVYSSTSITTT